MSSSLSIKSLANGLHNRSRLLALRHSSRGVNQPLFDRYGTIRSFFKRHNTELSVKPIYQRTRNGTTDFRRGVICSAATIQLSRQFHSCGHAEDRGRPRKGKYDNRTEPFAYKPLNNDVETDRSTSEAAVSDKDPNTEALPQPPPDVKKAPETSAYVEEPPQPSPLVPSYENYPESFRRLAMSLPHLHRHTRDDFLKLPSGFCQRAPITFI